MIKDITFGQFLPLNSYIHKMDARFKLVLTFALIVFAFVSFNFYSLLLMSAFTVVMAVISKVPLKMYLKTLKPILIFVVLTAVINIFYIKGEGAPLISFWIINIYLEGVLKALFVAVRIVLLVVISGALTYTTSPTTLTDAIESLLKPLTKMGVDIHTFAMMMTIALRFIPTLIEETDKISSAQKARGSDMDSGNFVQKIKSVLPILIPLLAGSIRRATELADAMECRCYHGGEGRTRMKVLKASWRDWLALFASCAVLAGIIVLNIAV